MLTEEKRKELHENLMFIGEQIRHLTNEKNACIQELVKDAVDQVKERFSHVAIGDKVKVRYTDSWNDRETEDTLYLKNFCLSSYYDPDNMPSYVRVEFFKTKKDGNQSLRTASICAHYIISIDKVTE